MLLGLGLALVAAFGGNKAQLDPNPPQLFPDSAVILRAAPSRVGRTYAVIVGVSQYADPSLRLRYPADDGKAVAAAFESRGVLTCPLIDPTRNEILDAIRETAQKLSARDTVVLYSSGHWVTDARDGKAYMVASDSKLDTDLGLASTCISATEIQHTFDSAQTRHQLLLVDSTISQLGPIRAGPSASPEPSIPPAEALSAKDPSISRAIIFAGRAGDSAYEEATLQHGIFTYALLKTISEAPPEGLYLTRLFARIEDWVKILSRENPAEQHPVMSESGEDFPVFDAEADRVLGNGLPVTIPHQTAAIGFVSPLLHPGDRVQEADGTISTVPADRDLRSGEFIVRAAASPAKIQILSTEKLAASSPGVNEVLIVGKVTGAGPIDRVTVGNAKAQLAAFGDFTVFTATPWVAAGTSRMLIVAKPQSGREENFTITIDAAKPSAQPQPPSGRCFALLVGDSNYGADSGYSPIPGPLKDIGALAAELKDGYGFDEVVPLPDPSKTQLLDEIKKWTRRADYLPSDRLLIVIAGHGAYDPDGKTGIGYFVPTGAKSAGSNDSNNDLLDYGTLNYRLNNIPCSHILVLIDACFGGAFADDLPPDRSAPVTKPSQPSELQKDLERLLQSDARLYFTSGGHDYVPDSSSSGHSPFVTRILSALKEGEREPYLTEEDLTRAFLSDPPMLPKPKGGRFGDKPPGHFVFVAKRP